MTEPASTPGPRRRGMTGAVAASVVAVVAALAVAALVQDTSGSSSAVTARPARPLSEQIRAARRPDPAIPRPRAQRFDADRALGLVVDQLRFGPRPAGSPALARDRRMLLARLPRGRVEPVPGGHSPTRSGRAASAYPLANLVGRIPGRRPAVVLAAHYDTQLRPRGFVGADDGAAGPAVVLEAARALARRPVPRGARELRFVLFDGEELPPGGDESAFAHDGLRGSKAYAAAHARELGAVVVADYVAGRGLRLPREPGSDPRLWSRVLAAAAGARTGPVFARTGNTAIVDDHVPFLEAGVPAVDLIDWSSTVTNTASDRLDRLSLDALDATGETMVAFLDAERRR